MLKKAKDILRQLTLVTLGLVVGVHFLKAWEKPSALKLAAVSNLPYTWKLYDFYDQGEFVLTPKTTAARALRSVRLSWSGTFSQRYFVQLSSRADFARAEVREVVGPEFSVAQPFIGENFWRVSTDRSHWADTQIFHVQPKFLQEAPPQLIAMNKQIRIDGDVKKAAIELKTSFEARGFIVEASNTDSFEGPTTKRFWTTEKKIELSFYEAGEFHYRFRAVSPSQDITDWSLPQTFTVTRRGAVLGMNQTFIPIH